MAGGLPQYAVLKCISNNKYVRCTANGSITLDGDDVLSPNCKLELERAKVGKDRVNIRSCYSNKYWEQGPNSSTLKATAAKPDEVQSNRTCTSFYTYFKAGTNDLWIYDIASLDVLFFCHGVNTRFIVTDWESLLILPKHVAFKGDLGTYLTAYWKEGHEYHKFESNDIGDQRVAYEVFPTGDGSVRIKSKYFNKFWRRSPNWIWADSSEDNNNNKDTLFVPVKVGKNTVALRNLGNNNFCVRLSKEWKENTLNADVSTITREAILTVEEVVLSREVSNVRFRLNDSRIYNENFETMVTREAINNNSEPHTITLKLAYKETSSRTFERGVTTSLSVSTTIEAGIPKIVDGQIQVTATIEGSFKWGTTEESSKEVEATDTVTVPPNTRVKVSVLATKGKCDVPFSYTLRDVLADGRVLTYDMDDGVYHGINSYNFKYETTKYKL